MHKNNFIILSHQIVSVMETEIVDGVTYSTIGIVGTYKSNIMHTPTIDLSQGFR